MEQFSRKAIIEAQWSERGTLAELTPTERAVLREYLRWANDAGVAWLTNDKLAAINGGSTGHLRRCRANLERFGLLKPAGKNRHYRQFQVAVVAGETIAKVRAGAHLEDEQRCARARTLGARPRATKVRAGAQKGARGRAPEQRNKGNTGEASANRPGPDGPQPKRDDERLFDAAAALELMCEADHGWRGHEVDARALIGRHGADLVRRAVQEVQWRIRSGRIRRDRFRGAVVRFMRDAADGRPWAEEARQASERKARRERYEREQAAAAEARRQKLDEDIDTGEAIWSQLSPDQRHQMRKQILASVGPNHPLHSMPAEGRFMRSAIIELAQQRGIAS